MTTPTERGKDINLTQYEQIMLLDALDTLPAHTVGKFVKQHELTEKLELLYGKRA